MNPSAQSRSAHWQSTGKKKSRLRLRRIFFALLALLSLLALLFVVNGLLLSDRDSPRRGQEFEKAVKLPPENRQLRVLSFNIAKLFIHHGGLRFTTVKVTRQRLSAVATLIKEVEPDLVFLSETVRECALCNVDQVANLARLCGMHSYVFGENYSFGLPLFRIVGGNAILSRTEISPVANIDLVGRQGFWITRNNRRILWARVKIAQKEILLGAIHNDSFDLDNNLRQVQQILDYAKGKDCILAGDFNAEPQDASMRAILDTKQFAGRIAGEATYPSGAPQRRLDYIFGPRTWEIVDHRVIPNEVSDHSAVLTIFRVGG